MNQKSLVLILVAVAAVYILYRMMQSAGSALGLNTPDPTMPEGSQSFPGVDPNKIYQFAYAVAVAEGFYSSGSIAQRANNPGDLEQGDIGYGTLGQGITVWPDLASGWQALYSLAWEILSGNASGYRPSQSFAQIGLRYSGGDPNWASNVAVTLGVAPSTTLEGWLAT